MKSRSWPLAPVVILFLVTGIISLAARSSLLNWKIDPDVVLIGNLVVFGATLLSYFFAARGLKTTNPHAFVRSVYSSIMIKMFICLAAVLIYIFMSASINKGGVFFCLGLYLLYTFAEVFILTKLAKPKTHA